MISISSVAGVVGIEDRSDPFIRRALIRFENVFSLSVICGAFSYGARDGLVELAIFDAAGDWVLDLWDAQDHASSDGRSPVLGYVDSERLFRYINKIAALPPGVTHE